MKKKHIIIASIVGASALIAGSAAVTIVLNNSNSKNKINYENNELLNESTLAEDEIFSNGLPSIVVNGEVKKSYNSANSEELLAPIIGRQYYYDETAGRVSIRFYAAITSMDVDAVWTRTLYNSDGSANPSLNNSKMTSTKAYSRLGYYENDELKYKTPKEVATQNGLDEDEASKYKYFVIYTLYNIKISTYGDCTIDANVEISNSTQTFVSKTGSVTTNSSAEMSSYQLELDMNNTYPGSSTSAGNGTYINGKAKTIYGEDEEFDSSYVTSILKGNTVTSSFSDFTVGKLGKQTIVVSSANASTTYDVYVLANNIAHKDADNNYVVTVDQSWSGTIGEVDGDRGNMFTTISQALEFLQNSNFVPTRAKKILNIGAGYYYEKLEINTPNLTINGSGDLAYGTYSKDENYKKSEFEAATIIEFDTLWGQHDSNGFTHVTDSTQTVAVRDTAVNCKIYGVTISNKWNCKEYFDDQDVTSEHRALALQVQADQFIMDNCSLLGYQDTLELFTGRQYFNECYISGTTDFIFGTNNTTYFNKCDIHSIDNGSSHGGYINAFMGQNKGEDDVKYGVIYYDCDFTADSDVPNGVTSIARPWGAYSAVAVINSILGAHISTDGFENNASQDKRYVSMSGINPTDSNVKFYEYNNKGTSAITKKVDGMSFLSADDAADYSSVVEVFGKSNGSMYYSIAWNPTQEGGFVDDRIVYSFSNSVDQYATVDEDNLYVYTEQIQGSSTTLGGLELDATYGKLYARGTDAQINKGTVITFSVAAGSEVVVRTYHSDSISLNGVISPNTTISQYYANATEITLECISNTYIYSIIINPGETGSNASYDSLSVSGYDTTEIKVGTAYSYPDDLVVKAINTDNTYRIIDSSSYEISNNINVSAAGDYTVTITYNNKSTSYPVYYRSTDHIVCSGGVSTQTVGETLDTTHLVVTGYLTSDDSNSFAVPATDYIITVYDSNDTEFDYSEAFEEEGTYTVTILYDGQTTSYEVTVESADTTRWTVTFVTDGSEVTSQSIIDKQYINTSDISTTKSGYVFKGWFSDSNYEELFDFTTQITEDITLYARFVKNENLTLENCTYYFDGTEGNGVDSFTYLETPQSGTHYYWSLTTTGKVSYATDRTQFNKDSSVSFAVGKEATVYLEFDNLNSSNYSVSLGETTIVSSGSTKSYSFEATASGTITIVNNGPNQMYLKSISVVYPAYIEENADITFGTTGNYGSYPLEIDGINTFNTTNSLVTGTIKFYVKKDAKVSIDAYGAGNSSYTITASGASTSTQTDDYSFVASADGLVIITGSNNNYLNGISISYPTYITNNANITFGTEGNYGSYPLEIDGINTFNTTNSKVTGTIKLYVNKFAKISIDAYGGGNSSYTITASGASSTTQTDDYTFVALADGLVTITGSENNYLNGITISYPTVITENINVTFGKDGNYATSGIDFSGCTNNSPNGDQANNQITGDFVILLKAGAKLTIDGYDSTSYCSYSVSINGGTAVACNNDYSITVDEDSAVIVSCGSKNYINGIIITYAISNDTFTFGDGGNFDDKVSDGIVTTSNLTNSKNNGYSQVKNGTITFDVAAGTEITITGYYSVDYEITIGEDVTLVQGTDFASLNITFEVESTTTVSIRCQTGEDYSKGNYFTSIAISKN